jgi:hypothetical protein
MCDAVLLSTLLFCDCARRWSWSLLRAWCALFRVAHIIRHPSYLPYTLPAGAASPPITAYKNDLALLRLALPISNAALVPIPLNTNPARDSGGVPLVVAGYGPTTNGGSAPTSALNIASVTSTTLVRERSMIVTVVLPRCVCVPASHCLSVRVALASA